MGTKIQITIKAEDDMPSAKAAAAMARTMSLLSDQVEVPTRKITLVVECLDIEAPAFEAMIEDALEMRDEGIEVVMKITREKDVEIKKSATVTPMDKVWRSDDGEPTPGAKVMEFLENIEIRRSNLQ